MASGKNDHILGEMRLVRNIYRCEKMLSTAIRQHMPNMLHTMQKKKRVPQPRLEPMAENGKTEEDEYTDQEQNIKLIILDREI